MTFVTEYVFKLSYPLVGIKRLLKGYFTILKIF